MFQTSESCIKLHAVVVLELLLSEQCPQLQVCVCVCVCVCSLLCVCVCVSTAPSVCALGWVKYREHISLLVILSIIVYDKFKINKTFFFFTKPIFDYGKMLKYWENIGTPIYRSISIINLKLEPKIGQNNKGTRL